MKNELEVSRKSSPRPKPKHFDDYVMYTTANDVSLPDPNTMKDEALSGPEASQCGQAIQDKLESFKSNDAWEEVNYPQDGSTLVQSKWVFAKKVP